MEGATNRDELAEELGVELQYLPFAGHGVARANLDLVRVLLNPFEHSLDHVDERSHVLVVDLGDEGAQQHVPSLLRLFRILLHVVLHSKNAGIDDVPGNEHVMVQQNQRLPYELAGRPKRRFRVNEIVSQNGIVDRLSLLLTCPTLQIHHYERQHVAIADLVCDLEQRFRLLGLCVKPRAGLDHDFDDLRVVHFDHLNYIKLLLGSTLLLLLRGYAVHE